MYLIQNQASAPTSWKTGQEKSLWNSNRRTSVPPAGFCNAGVLIVKVFSIKVVFKKKSDIMQKGIRNYNAP